MWCPKCHAEVAAEVDSASRRIRCATCQADLGVSDRLPGTSKTREARELLKRWSSESLLAPGSIEIPPTNYVTESSHESELVQELNCDPGEISSERAEQAESGSTGADTPTDFETPADFDFADASRAESPAGGKSPQTATGERRFRVDAAHVPAIPDPPPTSVVSAESGADVPEKAVAAANPAPPPAPAGKQRETAVADPPQTTLRADDSHGGAPSAPHFPIHAAADNGSASKPNWVSLGGQLLAYCGVGLMTIGAALVLWGYFGGPQHYLPTGWLAATAGQMLMFLGVITLVSSGMEQTTAEVSRQIEVLGNRIISVEQETIRQALAGPKLAASRFSQDAPAEESTAGAAVENP